jgi:hypothetical protein
MHRSTSAAHRRQWYSAAVRPGTQYSRQDEARSSRSSPSSNQVTSRGCSPHARCPPTSKKTGRLSDAPPIEVSCAQPSSQTQPRVCVQLQLQRPYRTHRGLCETNACQPRAHHPAQAVENTAVRQSQLRDAPQHGSKDSAIDPQHGSRKCSAACSRALAPSTATNAPSKTRRSVLHW